jgi:thymidylate kinase
MKLFIPEGIATSGKSTMAKSIQERLKAHVFSIITPGKIKNNADILSKYFFYNRRDRRSAACTPLVNAPSMNGPPI